MSDHQHNPPSFSTWLIRKLCKTDLIEEIEGNLMEYYSEVQESNGRFRRLKYWFEVLNYLRPSLLKFFKFKTKGPMFIFNPKVAFRNLLMHKSSTVISLLGFIVGLTSVIFLYFYIENEWNYDAFHADKDRIFRVHRTATDANGATYPIAVTSAPYAPALINDYPGTILSTVRVTAQDGLVTYENRKFYEDKLIFADENFFSFFSYPLKVGDPSSVLSGQYNVVISEEMARKYFGQEDPIGKILDVDNEYKYIVTGVFGEFPNKSHMEFDMVFSMGLFESFDWFDNWWNNGLATYVKTNSSSDVSYLNEQGPVFMEKYLGEDFHKYNTKLGLVFRALPDIYFDDPRYDPFSLHGSKTDIITLGSVALAILFIACFNYINLTIAQSHKRAKEVGIRKVLGVNKNRLILQFMGESLLILMLAVAVSVGLSELLRAQFNNFFNLNVIFDWQDINVIYFFVTLFIIIILASGLYPALLLSSFQPLKVLKTGKPALGSNILVRKGLVILQFSLSIFLIIATMLTYLQLNYLKDKELGFDKSATVIIDNNNNEIRENRESFKKALLSSRYVKNVTIASGEPGGFHDATHLEISGLDEAVQMNTVFTDPEYLKTHDIQVAYGRGFDGDLSSEEEHAMVVNEAALKATGLTAEELIGRKAHLSYRDLDRTIVGVVRDYHFADMKTEIKPLAIVMDEDPRITSVKIDGSNLPTALQAVEEIYSQFAPNFPMTSRLLDDRLADQYREEDKQAKVFTAFSGLSIFLACMGIFGLAAFSAQQRQKELSIRKVLGASVRQVVMLISYEFLILVAVAALLAIPFSWYFINHWLNDFAYRIDVMDHWVIFLLGGLLTTIVAFLTIGIKTYKTAASNPAEIMRYE